MHGLRGHEQRQWPLESSCPGHELVQFMRQGVAAEPSPIGPVSNVGWNDPVLAPGPLDEANEAACVADTEMAFEHVVVLRPLPLEPRIQEFGAPEKPSGATAHRAWQSQQFAWARAPMEHADCS